MEALQSWPSTKQHIESKQQEQILLDLADGAGSCLKENQGISPESFQHMSHARVLIKGIKQYITNTNDTFGNVEYSDAPGN